MMSPLQRLKTSISMNGHERSKLKSCWQDIGSSGEFGPTIGMRGSRILCRGREIALWAQVATANGLPIESVCDSTETRFCYDFRVKEDNGARSVQLSQRQD